MDKTFFDKKRSLNKAMRLFWRRGYENTSLSDLLKEMGILNGSFYNSFKNKRNVYIECIEMYSETILEQRLQKINQKNNLKDKLNYFFILLSDEAIPNFGCLVVNSLDSELFKNKDIKKAVNEKITRLKTYWELEIKKAIDQKEFYPQTSAEILSGILMTYIIGFSKQILISHSSSELKQQSENFIDYFLKK